MRRPAAPPGFVALDVPDAGFGFVRAEYHALVAAELARAGTLSAAAAGWVEPLPLGGRGVIRAARPHPDISERWVVRPYLRGGAVARVLVDRHLALGSPRPWIEERAIAALAHAGIPSVEVIGGVVRPAGLWYRAEIVTRFVPRTRTLADALFAADGGDETLPTNTREVWLRQAAGLCTRIATAGVLHQDLNARNLLLDGDELRVIDLDRARTGVRDPSRDARAMTSRLARSLRKFEVSTGRPLGAAAWRAFASGGSDPLLAPSASADPSEP